MSRFYGSLCSWVSVVAKRTNDMTTTAILWSSTVWNAQCLSKLYFVYRYYSIYFSGDFVLWKIDSPYTYVEVTIYCRCPCKTSYVTKFAKITFFQKSMEDIIAHLLRKREFSVPSGSRIFWAVSKPRMSRLLKPVRAKPRNYLVCVLLHCCTA